MTPSTSRKDRAYLGAVLILAFTVVNAFAGAWPGRPDDRLDLYSLLVRGELWSPTGWSNQEWILLVFFCFLVYIGLSEQAPESRDTATESLQPEQYRPLGPGEVIDSYQVEALIHVGSFISRYRVRHTMLDTHHCLLVITEEVPMIRARQTQAGKLQARLRHTNLVRATDLIVIESDVPAVVLDWFEGTLLSRHLELSGPMSVSAVDGLAVGLCRALDHMHQHGLVHRNVKPGGIALIPSGDKLVPKLTDLALTKVRSSEQQMTQAFSKLLIGTPAYMAPEQIRLPDSVTASADVWSLCVVLYEALAGHPPFRGKDARAVLTAVRRGDFEPIQDVVPGLPQRVIDALNGGLEYDEEDRTPTMRALLETWCGDEEDLGTLRSNPAPSGDVSLAFTDVQGSTAFWDEDPELMRKVLTAHDTIMRAVLTRHGGYEVKTEGDAFMVAFDTPLRAVQWCMDVQDAIDSQPWPQEMRDRGWRLRVRMGVHSGSPDCRPHPTTGAMDYFGPMVNCAARISNAGHGGQIVASETTMLKCRDSSGTLQFRSLGTYRLKGITEPQQIWQVGTPEATFPALRAEPVEASA
jgi:class 3 adenylate cyclase